MSVQEISVTNNQKKAVLRAFKKVKGFIEEDNGDLVIDIAHYQDYQAESGKAPLEEILVDEIIQDDTQYLILI